MRQVYLSWFSTSSSQSGRFNTSRNFIPSGRDDAVRTRVEEIVGKGGSLALKTVFDGGVPELGERRGLESNSDVLNINYSLGSKAGMQSYSVASRGLFHSKPADDVLMVEVV